LVANFTTITAATAITTITAFSAITELAGCVGITGCSLASGRFKTEGTAEQSIVLVEDEEVDY
jgi:hypothetical protein